MVPRPTLWKAFVEDLRVDDRVSSIPDLIFGSTVTPILYRHADALTGFFGMEVGLYEGELILNFEAVDANAPGPFVSHDIRESAIFNTSDSPIPAPATWTLFVMGRAALPWVTRWPEAPRPSAQFSMNNGSFLNRP